MNKKYIIRKNETIKYIISLSNKIVNKFFILYYAKNDLGYPRYCVSVSKKIGKANIRNLYKRRIKDILMKNNFINSNDYVIILRTSVLSGSYKSLENEIKKIIKGDNNE